MSYATEVLADSPVLYWRLGEPSGATAEDATANDRDGTYAGCTFSVAGAVDDGDTAVTLDGTDDRITRADEAALDLGDVMTIEAWAKRGATGGPHTIASKDENSFDLRFHNDRLQFLKANVALIVESTITVTDTTTWHHCVATKDGTSVFLYIDGVDVTGSVSNQTLTNTAQQLAVGSNLGGEWFNGSLDEFALYSTALSAARVLAHYEAAAPVAAPTLQVVRSSLRF